MKNLSLIEQPHNNILTNIFTRFENGKPLNSDQLNFLLQHESVLKSHELDLVFKYYLGEHAAKPKQVLQLPLQHQKCNAELCQQIKTKVHHLLKHNLKHVDLQMSVDQYLQFKAVGLHELLFWHGPQFLTRTAPFLNATPQVVYMQWGKLFGVVKLNAINESNILDGNVLIYFEDMDVRSLNQCVLDYATHHKVELKQEMVEKNHITETLTPQPLSPFAIPTLTLSTNHQTEKQE